MCAKKADTMLHLSVSVNEAITQTKSAVNKQLSSSFEHNNFKPTEKEVSY